MFTYLSDFTKLSHYLINEFVKNKNIAIDGTLGNGFDTDFLKEQFKFVYSFDIQKEACEKYLAKKIDNVRVINDSHHHLNKYVNEKVSCIIYNLGFLPGGNKSITTKSETTLESVEIGLNLLCSGGFMFVLVYRGHEAGMKEWTLLKQYFKSLPKNIYGVMEHNVINRSISSPLLYVIEKK